MSSASTNQVLLYSDSKNFNKKKGGVDLVLFAQGLGLSSVFLFSPYETGGLEISPFSKNKYREAVVFFAIDTQSTKHFASKNTVNNLIDQSSPINQVVKLPQKTKIIMLVGKKDITVPPKQSYIYFERAKKLKKNIYLHEVDAEHDTHQIDKKLRALVHELLD